MRHRAGEHTRLGYPITTLVRPLGTQARECELQLADVADPVRRGLDGWHDHRRTLRGVRSGTI